MIKFTKRLLAALFGGIIFAILVPIGWFLAFDGFPLENFIKGALVLIGSGFAIGALLGALFPKVFGFIFEMFFDELG